MTFLLDTNVVSDAEDTLRRGQCRSGRLGERPDDSSLFISVITLQELEIGVLLAERRDTARGAHLRHWLETQVIPVFSGRTLPVDAAVARQAARFHVPQPRPFRDSLIGATAHRMRLVTRNVGDCESMGVRVLNPWSCS